MTVVRRILIGVVGLLLLLDVAALGIVKFGAGPAPSNESRYLDRRQRSGRCGGQNVG